MRDFTPANHAPECFGGCLLYETFHANCGRDGRCAMLNTDAANKGDREYMLTHLRNAKKF